MTSNQQQIKQNIRHTQTIQLCIQLTAIHTCNKNRHSYTLFLRRRHHSLFVSQTSVCTEEQILTFFINIRHRAVAVWLVRWSFNRGVVRSQTYCAQTFCSLIVETDFFCAFSSENNKTIRLYHQKLKLHRPWLAHVSSLIRMEAITGRMIFFGFHNFFEIGSFTSSQPSWFWLLLLISILFWTLFLQME
jgi:hypothetical protein